MSKISSILEEAKDLKPISEENGTKVFGADDYAKAVMKELADPSPDIGTREINPDGSIARSRTVVAVVNENALYGNLGCVKKLGAAGGTEVWLAPQAVQEDYEFVSNPQYIPHKVKVFVFRQSIKKEDEGRVFLHRIMMVDGAEARSQLVNSYNEDFMKTCLELISENGQEITKEESPFK